MCGRVKDVCGVGVPCSLHTILEHRVQYSSDYHDHEGVIQGAEVRVITTQRSAWRHYNYNNYMIIIAHVKIESLAMNILLRLPFPSLFLQVNRNTKSTKL